MSAGDPLSDSPRSPDDPPALAVGLEERKTKRLTTFFFGRPLDPHDRRLFHRLSLVPVLAWIGLGADGLSSSAYGPEAAFGALGEHTFLAVPLALLTALTVGVISACYMRIIEVFPYGGGGYLVASKLLGRGFGIVAGSALLVDYVLTITVSVAAAGDALFSLLPAGYQSFKLSVSAGAIVFLTLLNIRGVRESVLILVPIFTAFLVTHMALIACGILVHLGDFGGVAGRLGSGFQSGLSTLGTAGMLVLFFQAYSLGGGTYTGIEAVSNSLNVLREPRVESGKRTMVYMAVSLSITAAGLILCYLLAHVAPASDRTMNATLTQDVLENVLPASPVLQGSLLIVTLVSEGALLIVAAQAGFLGGPRVMANMAIDSYLPHRFAALSDRFTTMNGILLMAAASLAALFYTQGEVKALVVMYSINVFVTFSLAQLGMIRYWLQNRGKQPCWRRRLLLFSVGFLFCTLILSITVYEKFSEGGKFTLAATGGLVLLCLLVKRHYNRLSRIIGRVRLQLEQAREEGVQPRPFDPNLPTAVLLVSGYGGLGMHTILKILQGFPNYFRGFHFISVGTIDTGNFKGAEEIEALERSTKENLERFVEYAANLGFPARYDYAIGTDTVDELADLCLKAQKELRHAVFFSGKVIFERERWYHFLFHNQTAYTLQKRLQWGGIMMVIIPLRIFEPTPARAE